MVNPKRRIAIVEFSPVHDLTFTTLAHAAQALGAQLDIFAPNALLEQTAVLPGNVHRVRIGPGRRAGTVPAIVCRLMSGSYDAVWVNTAHGPRARSLLLAAKLLLPRRCLRLGGYSFHRKPSNLGQPNSCSTSLMGRWYFQNSYAARCQLLRCNIKTFAWSSRVTQQTAATSRR